MSKQFKFLLAFSLLFALMSHPSLVDSQEETALPEVAILVIDVFEIEEPVLVEPEALEGENCVVSPDGQDGAGWGGGSGITSALNPFSEPHGRLVYREMQHTLQAEHSGSLVRATTGMAEFSIDWIRDIESWDVPDSGIMELVAIDTDGYTTELITDRIVEAINLYRDEGVSRFVINMSFVLLPCDDFPELTVEDYETLLQTLDDPAFDTPRRQFDRLPANAQAQLAFLRRPEFAPLRRAAYLTVMAPGLREKLNVIYPDALGDVRNCAEIAQANPQNDAIFLNDDPLFGLLAAVQGSAEQIDLQGAASSMTSPTAGSSKIVARQEGEPEPPEPCRLIDQFPEPLPPDIQDLQNAVTIGELVVIPVAAAGNEGHDFPYVPGYWPGVISVSADYEALSECTPDEEALRDLLEDAEIDVDDLEAIIDDLVFPRSNDGEVRMNGVAAAPDSRDDLVGCLRGTSFAAPRLSAEAAVYLLGGGEITCSGAFDVSSPPLAHLPWDNLARIEGGARYCTTFNTLVP